jgi:L-lactate dehydrogenase complex protein LldG
MSAREDILGRVRAALKGTEAIGAPGSPEVAAPTDLDSHAARVDAFRTRLAAAEGHLEVVADEAQAAAVLSEVVSRARAKRIAVSDAPLVAKLTRGLEGVELVDAADRAGLLAAEAGISCVQHAVAETGTLVLETHSERNRLVSLLPPLHVAVLHADAILATLGDALAAVDPGGAGSASRAVTFISGPSRTADIELKLVVGVHGPRELTVLLIDPRTRENAP